MVLCQIMGYSILKSKLDKVCHVSAGWRYFEHSSVMAAIIIAVAVLEKALYKNLPQLFNTF